MKPGQGGSRVGESELRQGKQALSPKPTRGFGDCNDLIGLSYSLSPLLHVDSSAILSCHR
ncbi:hypothetical protein PanWU01x14_153350 [Parasponia andersonii]|uniref:Uncharacterized protein n=1 Tax=Parasponia andersonii TaxID=3476 RepID=A0A2P5CH14_PARAD|nr:hypothetical protein PanWU01x14_153350 [Parasponia andersonii]